MSGDFIPQKTNTAALSNQQKKALPKKIGAKKYLWNQQRM
jgi:hypothetical protein